MLREALTEPLYTRLTAAIRCHHISCDHLTQMTDKNDIVF